MDLHAYISHLWRMSFPKIEEFMTNDPNQHVKRPSGASFVQCLWIIEDEAYANVRWFQFNLKPFVKEVGDKMMWEYTGGSCIAMQDPTSWGIGGDVVTGIDGRGVTVGGDEGVTMSQIDDVEKLKQEADCGDVISILSLGDMYRVGRLTTKDQQQAFQYYKKAADSGNLIGNYKVGLCYDYGIGVPVNLEESAKYLQKAADQDLPDAQYKLAWQYEKGKGVPADLSIAFDLLKKAAISGHIYAQYNLAVYYEEQGRSWTDPCLSVEWYLKAAQQGHSRAQNNLGYQFHNGRGVPKDYQMAYYWYKTAADQGHDCGQYNVGFMWHNGHGVPKNPKNALIWYKKAADQGYLSAQKLLASIFTKGEEGISIDHLQATHYHITYLLTSEKEDENARKFLINRNHIPAVNYYLSLHWTSLFQRLRKELRHAVLETVLVLKEIQQQQPQETGREHQQLKIPVELWWMVCQHIVRRWPESGYFFNN